MRTAPEGRTSGPERSRLFRALFWQTLRQSLLALPSLSLKIPTLANQILEGNRMLLSALGSGLWPVMVLVSEVVQTFILADFWLGKGRGG